MSRVIGIIVVNRNILKGLGIINRLYIPTEEYTVQFINFITSAIT